MNMKQLQRCYHPQKRIIINIGQELTYSKPTLKCPCGAKYRHEEHSSKIKEIRLYPDTGFCEKGDTMEIELINGDVLTGDTENGFSNTPDRYGT